MFVPVQTHRHGNYDREAPYSIDGKYLLICHVLPANLTSLHRYLASNCKSFKCIKLSLQGHPIKLGSFKCIVIEERCLFGSLLLVRLL